MSDDRPFFLKQNTGLGTITDADDFLHRAQNALVTADSATETQYFGFSVPEARIHGYAYLWYHPSLRVVTGGLFAFQGHKRTAVNAELSDFRTYHSDRALEGDLHGYRLSNGYGVEVLEPLKRHRLTFADAARGNAVDLVYEAVQPPVMFGDGTHFEQPMRVRGTLSLRGAAYAVDGFNVRDRSWAKPRPEDNLPMPPFSWMTGVFDPGFAFNCSVFDQEVPRGAPKLPVERTLTGGWVHRDGRLGRLVKAVKRVERTRFSLLPSRVQLEMTDEHGRTFAIDGEMIASTVWQPWSNIYMPVCLMKWTCEGRVAHGDCQEGIWTDYLNAVNPEVPDAR